MIKKIRSVTNSEIKEYTKLLKKSKARREAKLFLIEGARELNIAIKNNYSICKIMFNTNLIDENEVKKYVGDKIKCIEVSQNVYNKISYRSSTEGIIALAKEKSHKLEKLKFKSTTPLIMILDGIEKPGNIGALLRTSDAAKVDAVFIVNQKTDLYNPNIIRSSVGCIFTNNLATGSTSEIIAFLKEKKAFR